MWSYGSTVQDETGKHVTLNSKETVEAVKFVAALYKEAMTPDVLSWNDASNNQYIDSGVSSLIINPISAYRTAQQLNKKVADDIFVMKPPKGPVRQLIGRRTGIPTESGSSPRTRRRRSRSSSTTPITGSRPSRQVPDTTCRSCQYRAQADAAALGRSNLDAARQAGDPADLRRVVGCHRLSGTGLARAPTRSTTTSSSAT